MFQEQILVRFGQSFTASTVRESHMAGNFSAYYGKPWSFKAVVSKQLKVGSQTQCLRKASWVIIQVLSDITHWNLFCFFQTQGSRDDLSTAGGFQSQTAMKHANSVDTSFSKDVLNSIAGTNDRLNRHVGRFVCISVHCAFCLEFMEDIINFFYTISRETWYAMFLFPLGVFGLTFFLLWSCSTSTASLTLLLWNDASIQALRNPFAWVHSCSLCLT